MLMNIVSQMLKLLSGKCHRTVNVKLFCLGLNVLMNMDNVAGSTSFLSLRGYIIFDELNV